jgi:HK97 family phage prohead protease
MIELDETTPDVADIPRDNLTRSVEFRAENSDGLTLEGYAAVFDQTTEINSWEGNFQERIAKGAFAKTIRENKPILQFDHGAHPLIGSMPLGTIKTIREDDHGLFIRARLSDNWLVEPVRDAIRDGAITGMSFRFKVINDTWQQRNPLPLRTITEVALYEAGPVVFPAYSQTSVGVRSRALLTALADPDVRAELARALLTGTMPEEDIAAALADEPTPAGHSEQQHTGIHPSVARARIQALLGR